MIKIFGGVAKGFTLKTPSSSATRPTSVLLRRKLFDSLQSLEGFLFVDLCAGTGSVGLEAASRNAEKVIFVENSKQAFHTLKSNLSDVKKKYPLLKTEFESYQIDFKKWYTTIFKEQLYGNRAEYTCLIFFDPPYEKKEAYENLMALVKESDFRGKLVIEACEQKTMKMKDFEKAFGKYQKLFKQGSRYFVIYDFD